MKDRGGARRRRRDPDDYEKKSSQRTLNRYKQKLEELFTPGKKLSKETQQHLKKLRETTDREQFQELADAYIKEFGLPHAWEDLENFLRHRDPQVLSETIRRMEALMPEQPEVRRGNFQKDLNVIEMTARDKDLRRQVTQLLKKFSVPA